MAYYFNDPRFVDKYNYPGRPTLRQKCHYTSYHGSDHDIMAKRRLASRTFGFKRNTVYPSRDTVEPSPEAPYYATEEERLNSDMNEFSSLCQRKYKQRKDELLKAHKAGKVYQQFKDMSKREDLWNKSLERDEFMRKLPHGRVKSNTSAVHYDIITLAYEDSYGGRLVKYEDDMLKWREILRRLFLTTKSTGCQNFNILNWNRSPPLIYPDKPEAPMPDPPVPPKARLRQVLVYPERPPELTPVIDGKPPEQLFDPTPEPPKEDKLRELLVHKQHPWELTQPEKSTLQHPCASRSVLYPLD